MGGVRRAVLITGARAPVALDLARSFAAAGFDAHLADSVPSALANASNAPAAVHRYAPPRLDRQGFRRDLGALVARLDPVLIAPTCEEVFNLAAAAAELGFADRVFAPPLKTLRRLHAKSGFAAACHELGIQAPATRLVESREALAAFAPASDRLVFKPEFSRAGDRTLVRPNAAALARIRPTPADPWCVQDAIEGREVCFYGVVHGGALTAFSAYAPRWQTAGGAGYVFEPLDPPLTARLRDIARQLAGQVVQTGQFACDAIVDPGGQPWLIECNPRATSGVHLFARGGDLARAMLHGTPCEPLPGLRYLSPALAFFGLPDALARGRLGDLLQDAKAGEDVIGAPGDRLPAVGAAADGLAFQLGALLRGRSLADQMTRDMCWNGEAL
jgi:hypothetical protein